MRNEWRRVGTVLSISRFPVKAFRGESIDRAHLGWHGIDGDRRWALYRVDSVSGLPWASARRFPVLSTYEVLGEPLVPRVLLDDGGVRPFSSPDVAEVMSSVLAENVRPFQLWRGTYDSMPLSIVTTSSVDSLSSHVQHDLSLERFRSNLVIDDETDRAFPEEKWVGSEIRFGKGSDSARLRLDRKTERCNVIDVDPATGKADAPAFEAIADLRRKNLGAYGSTVRPGQIEVGMEVLLRV